MNEVLVALAIIGGIVLVGGVIFLFVWMERKRKEAFAQLADRLGLIYRPERNYELAKRYEFLGFLAQGENRYVQNCLAGTLNGLEVLVFEHHYETQSTNSKGQRSTDHHYTGVFTTSLPKTFPALTIRPEGIFSKIAQAFGYADIDFESAEFSRRYCVRSRDKKFAYDVCHPLAMEFLLEHHNLEIEIAHTTMASLEPGIINLETVESTLRRLLAFRRLLPDYLLKS